MSDTKTCTPKNLAELSAAIGQSATDRAVAAGIEQSWYSAGRDAREIYKDISKGSVTVEYELEPDDVDGFHDDVLDTLCEIDIQALGKLPLAIEKTVEKIPNALAMLANEDIEER